MNVRNTLPASLLMLASLACSADGGNAASLEMDNESISDLTAGRRCYEACPGWLANNPFGIIAFLNGADRVPQNPPEHDYAPVRSDEMLEAVQRDGTLAFHRFFVVGMALGIFVARILASCRRKL